MRWKSKVLKQNKTEKQRNKLMTHRSELVPLASQGSMRTARLNRLFAWAAIDRVTKEILRTRPIHSTCMRDAWTRA